MAYYDTVLAACETYMHGDAKRFLDRQIEFHLKKPPAEIDAGDAEELGMWCRVSGKLVIGEQKATDLEQDILKAA